MRLKARLYLIFLSSLCYHMVKSEVTAENVPKVVEAKEDSANPPSTQHNLTDGSDKENLNTGSDKYKSADGLIKDVMNLTDLIKNYTVVEVLDWKELQEEQKKQGRRLTGSRYTWISDYPYVASIQKRGEHWCTGAIITERVVITSADCMLHIHKINGPILNDRDIKVRMGSSNPLYGGVLAGVQEIARHPNWGVVKTPRHNLALLVLDVTLVFTDTMHSVELPKKEQLPPFNDSWVSGWGAVKSDGIWTTSVRQLRVYRSIRLPREDCLAITNETKVELVDSFMCFSQKYRRAPCTRDVGAPAVSDGILWGIASWSIREPCGTVRNPAVFEYLGAPANLKWIMKSGREMTARALEAKIQKPA